MCGRFNLFTSVEIIMDEFNIEKVLFKGPPSYNISPGREVASISFDEGKVLSPMRWGLIPSWAEDPSIGYRMINARAETIHEKNSFKIPFRERRCLIPADGFYEWKTHGKVKMPYHIRMVDRKPFAFAGLFDVWRSPEGVDVRSCTIITTKANDTVSPIHDRMPVILPKDAHSIWLDPEMKDIDEFRVLLEPYDPEKMEAYEISQLVNSASNDSEELVKRLERWF